MPGVNRLYFAHSYQPTQRRFNERIWRELMGQDFISWVDRGLERGTGGRRYPMDVSFNEWMMSRCDGFIAVVPTTGSAYVDLEYRLAVRMGLPTLVLAAEGADFREGTADCEFPLSWNAFLTAKTSSAIARNVVDFAKRIRSAQAAVGTADPGRRRLRARVGGPSVAFLPPNGDAKVWAAAYGTVSARHPASTFLVPMNYRRPWDLIAEIDGKYDLLVVDVGPNGTPREMLGYLEAHAIPLVRVCQVPDSGADSLAQVDAGVTEADIRRPYVQAPPSAPLSDTGVSLLTDGLHIDADMRPVLFFSNATQLSFRVLDLVGRIQGFLHGFEGTGDEQRITLETHRQARDYFAPPEDAGRVFLSFAGAADAPDAKAQKRALADQLVSIFRFNDLRCFHYLDKDPGVGEVGGRLESGEAIDQGLEKQVEDSDVVVVLFDAAYSRSEYCMNELRQATALRERGLLKVRAYRLSGSADDLAAFHGINVLEHRGTWSDSKLRELVVDDAIRDCRELLTTLRAAEAQQVRSWLESDGFRTCAQVRRLLARGGLAEEELAGLGIDEAADVGACVDRLLTLPADKAARQRRRAIVTFLLSALASGNDDRMRLVNRWMRQRNLAGRLPKAAVTFEQVFDVPDSPVAPEPDADVVMTGVRMGQVLPGVLVGTNPLVLGSGPRAAELPVEWARENAETDAICLRRQVRWRLPYRDHRDALVEDLSSRAMPPRWLLVALKGDGIDPEAEIRQVGQTLADLYRAQDWPPEFVKTVACEGDKDVQAQLQGCSYEVVHLSGHMGSHALQVGGDEIASDTLGQWLANSKVRLVVLNGCEGARPRSSVALYSVAMADRIVDLGKVPEVVAHRRPLTDSDSVKFATSFCSAFARSFDAVAACFEARRAGSEQLRYSPLVISQRKPRSA